MEQVLIFDGDDTLWSTELLYDAARTRARQAVETHGLDGARWEAIERARDVENVKLMGLTAVRFPTSCVEALYDVTLGGAASVPPTLPKLVWEAALTVFTAPAPLVPGAREVLVKLSAEHTIVLLTKGDAEVQMRRVLTSDLAPLFDHVEVVDEKSSETFRDLARRLGVEASDAVSIGNSLASDILPAVEAGMNGIWIDAHVWEYERARNRTARLPEGAMIAESIHEVPMALKELSACH